MLIFRVPLPVSILTLHTDFIFRSSYGHPSVDRLLVIGFQKVLCLTPPRFITNANASEAGVVWTSALFAIISVGDILSN